MEFPWNDWNVEQAAKHDVLPEQAEMTRKTRSGLTTKMTTGESVETTAEFDKESVIDSFRRPTPAQRAKLQRAKRKRGRPKVGKGVKVISVSIEQGLLEEADRLAKKLKVRRTRLISRGLRAVLDREVTIDR
jgi:hypothetical protein